MIQFIQHCGIIGILTLMVTAVLALIAIVVACISKHRRALAVLAVAALFPFALGLLGTGVGYSQTRSTSVALNLDDATIESGRKTAREASYLGLGCTAFLWLICGVAAITRKRTAEPASGR